MNSSNPKLKGATDEEKDQRIEFETKLWQINDPRTYAKTGLEMLTLIPAPKHVGLEVHHVAIRKDHFLNHLKVEQHLRTIYSDCHVYMIKLPMHAPSLVASAKEVAPLIPPKLRAVLRRPA